MQTAEVIRHCEEIVAGAGQKFHDVTTHNFLDQADLVRDILNEWTKRKLANTPWIYEFTESLRRCRDDFEAIVAADPMCLYKPAHDVALEFHASPALIRYFRGGNRISKTQAGVADNYWVLTGQHPYRPHSPMPCAVGVVSVNFSKYGIGVYDKKYVKGEGGNPLSPAFPEGGKWFNHWDVRRHVLTIACPECAEKGKPQSCKHPKSSITLFSDNEGPDALQGCQLAQLQFDEHIDYGFYGEGLKRLDTVPHSGLIVTGTPLQGRGSWEHKFLTSRALAGEKIPGTDTPLVSLHTIDQYSAGLVPRERIDAAIQTMSKPEAEARVWGRPAAFAETAVFDSNQIGEMQDEIKPPKSGMLLLPGELQGVSRRESNTKELLYDALESTVPTFHPYRGAPLRVWEKPNPKNIYFIGADVAQGLTSGDASCASVIKVTQVGLDYDFEMVAQYHTRINSLEYADELFKLALYYGIEAGGLVIERNGPGDASIQQLKEYGNWHLFRDMSAPEAAGDPHQSAVYGLSTNVKTKGVMVSMLQKVIWDQATQRRSIKIYCPETIDELGSYGQNTTEKGNVSYSGQGGMHDDRVISIVMAIYPIMAYGLAFNPENKETFEPDPTLPTYDQDFWRDVHGTS